MLFSKAQFRLVFLTYTSFKKFKNERNKILLFEKLEPSDMFSFNFKKTDKK